MITDMIIVSIIITVTGAVTFMLNYDPKVDDAMEGNQIACIGALILSAGLVGILGSVITNIIVSDIHVGAVVSSISFILLIIGLITKSIMKEELCNNTFISRVERVNFFFLLGVASGVILMTLVN